MLNLNSDKDFNGGDEIQGDEVIPIAFFDGLVPHRHVVNIRGDSYRFVRTTSIWRTL